MPPTGFFPQAFCVNYRLSTSAGTVDAAPLTKVIQTRCRLLCLPALYIFLICNRSSEPHLLFRAVDHCESSYFARLVSVHIEAIVGRVVTGQLLFFSGPLGRSPACTRVVCSLRHTTLALSSAGTCLVLPVPAGTLCPQELTSLSAAHCPDDVCPGQHRSSADRASPSRATGGIWADFFSWYLPEVSEPRTRTHGRCRLCAHRVKHYHVRGCFRVVPGLDPVSAAA